jgi:hypothetical protein
MLGFIQEAHRVLRKNGVIIIKEIIGGETKLSIPKLSSIDTNPYNATIVSL